MLLPPLTVLEFHRSGGPSLGHCGNRPVSGEMASRCGPRHCGQSLDLVMSSAWAALTTRPSARTTRGVRYMEILLRREVNKAGQPTGEPTVSRAASTAG